MKTLISCVRRTMLLRLFPIAVLLTGTAPPSQGGFTISTTNEVITQGTLGSSPITVTPRNGYTGNITFTVTGSSPAFANGCVLFANYANVSGVNPTTVGSLTVATKNVDCPPNSIGNSYGGATIGAARPTGSSLNASPLGVVMGGFLLVGMLGRRSDKLRRLSGLLVLMALGGFALGCSTAAPLMTPKGVYDLTLVGTDNAATPNLTATTTFTVTIQ